MVKQCPSFFKQVDSNGLILKSLTWININRNIPAIVREDMFSKLILSIIKSYENYNDYPLAPDKIEIKREMLFEYDL